MSDWLWLTIWLAVCVVPVVLIAAAIDLLT
jgi:hypothetical protein